MVSKGIRVVGMGIGVGCIKGGKRLMGRLMRSGGLKVSTRSA